MRLVDLAKCIDTEENAVAFSGLYGLLPIKFIDCNNCFAKESCVWIKKSEDLGICLPYQIRCIKCKNEFNMTKNTFFERENMTLISQVYKVIYEFLLESSLEEAAAQSKMSIEKVSKWYNYCTEVCYLSYIKNQEKIGGQDEIVEIGNIILSSNKTVGNMIIFGGIARNTKKCFAVNVKSTSKEDILQKLVHNVLPGSKIISSYSFFKELKNLGYSSESVNNCPRSVSPKNPSIHILNLFRMWRSLKQVYDRGLTDLCLYTFLYFNKKKLLLASERFLPFLKDISDLYPVYKVEKFMVEE